MYAIGRQNPRGLGGSTVTEKRRAVLGLGLSMPVFRDLAGAYGKGQEKGMKKHNGTKPGLGSVSSFRTDFWH
jgi:hypothetical protein